MATTTHLESVPQLTFDQTINVLKRRLRAAAKEVADIFEDGKRALKDSEDVMTFNAQMLSLDKYFKRYEDIFEEILVRYEANGQSGAFPSASEQAAFDLVRKYYKEAQKINLQIKAKSTGPPAIQLESTIASESSSSSYLPKMNLPKFNGEMRDWPKFKDTFLSLIHDDPGIPEIRKYHYLVTSLSGSALAAISSLPLNATNYSIAWKALLDIFDNKRLLASAYLNTVLDFRPQSSKLTATAINSFLSRVAENISAFKLLNIPDEAGFILYYMAARCFSSETREQFELSLSQTRQGDENKGEFPTYQDLEAYLRRRLQAFQLSDQKEMLPYPSKESTSRRAQIKPPPTSFVVQESNQRRSRNEVCCPVCKGPHTVRFCSKFLSVTPSERYELIRNWNGCKNCLASDHSLSKCSSIYSCRFCKKRHHSLLHLETSKGKENTKQVSGSSTTLVASPRSVPETTVLLGTAVAEMMDTEGNRYPVRLVVDSGSQATLITSQLVKRLHLQVKGNPGEIQGVGAASCNAQGRTSFTIFPRSKLGPNLRLDALVVDKITNKLPSSPVDRESSLEEIPLADPLFHEPQTVQLLIGADYYLDVMLNGKALSLGGGAKLLPSIFGYIALGRIKTKLAAPIKTFMSQTVKEEEICKALRRFWEIEEPCGSFPKLSSEEEVAEEHFSKTHSRTEEGRYVVRLPFRHEPASFVDSEQIVLKRFLNLEAKLERDPEMRTKYAKFMADYEQLNHMEKTQEQSRCVLPHHAVLKSGKIRVVFDASAGSSNGSLNNALLTGPRLQRDIWQILLNFRRHRFVFVTDVIKMYRQIMVHREDRAFQHILWRSNPSDVVERYQLNTLTYGLSSAPFLAQRTMLQLAKDEGEDFPLAAKVLKEDIYMDDIVTGASSSSEVKDLQEQLIALTRRGGFELSKWSSNDRRLIPGSSASDAEPFQFGEDEDQGTKILGIIWSQNDDTFSYKVVSPPIVFTKRGIMSTVARIYDPLGYIAPITFYAKVMLQELWAASLTWDEDIGEERRQKWTQFCKELKSMEHISIPRWLFETNTSCFQLIGFADASQKGYSAAMYLRTESSSNQYRIRLIMAKTKVAPLKTISVPRLELCAAVLLANVATSLRPFLSGLEGKELEPAFFSDSEIALAWIRTPPYKLKTFIANRVSQIVEGAPPRLWRHIKSKDNPADCSCRGLLPGELVNHSLWWTGPSWLELPNSSWPANHRLEIPSEAQDEMKGISLLAATIQDGNYLLDCIERYSSFMFTIKVFGWTLRFINSARSKQHQRTGPLSVGEIRQATRTLIKIVQCRYFGGGRPVTNETRLDKNIMQLRPFLDNEGVLRVGGRLRHSKEILFDQRHPILLPSHCHLTTILVDHYHKVNLHPGPTMLQALIQLRYWVPSLRKLVRRRTYLCKTCFVSNAKRKATIPLMGDLPECRVSSARAFLHVGIDFAGPFLIRLSTLRKAPLGKAYMCLFVCMSTKATHLEMVSSLSTEAFLACLDRFVARRGLPTAVYSDNGTNFVGASRQMKELAKWWDSEDVRKVVLSNLQAKEVKWHFNPPHSPHFGGLWEATVKSAKTILRKIIGEQTLTFEEWHTLLARVESILNSRPLCPLSNSPEETNYLSPGHFLIGGNLLDPPEYSYLETNANRLSRWELLRHLYQTFWRRWSTEYLGTLQRRPKWSTSSSPSIAVGDLVLMKNEQTPPKIWPMGKVIDVHPGADNVVRVATLKIGGSEVRRAVHNLVKLPLESL